MSKMRIAALDIGGTSVKGGLIENGQIIERKSGKTDISGGLGSIRESIYHIAGQLVEGAAGIAVSSAGDIDAQRGVCLYATGNLPGYSGFEICREISAKYGFPCSAINDAHAAILAEVEIGAARGRENAVMLTLGTGIGGGLYRNGEVVFGKNYTEGRFGHILLKHGGMRCTCGKTGCAECYCSAKALLRRAQESGLDVTDGYSFFEKVRQNDIISQSVLDDYLQDIAQLINIIAEMHHIDYFILGGGISGSGAFWLPELAMKCPNRTTVLAETGNDAGLYGAYFWYLRKFGKNFSLK